VGFSAIDYSVLLLYLAGITVFGMRFRKSQRTIKDYFVGAKNISWPVIGLSIVATETSTLTLIGVPALAYSTFAHGEQGGNLTYLQVVVGYIIGRFVISMLFIPAYFEGELLTAYELLKRRFGVQTKNFAASLFLVMRATAEGVRVFAASIVLGAVLTAGLPGLPHLWMWSIITVGLLTLLYTFEGGIAAVIWTDLIQLAVYVAGSLLAAYQLLHFVPGGWSEIAKQADAANKFQTFSFAWNFDVPFTFWGGLLGGTFFTMASHGTDQLLVQRLLTCRNRRDSQKALVFSGFVVLFQFALFLMIGIMLFAYYKFYPLAGKLASNDEIFPTFIVSRLPHGVSGLVIAAIFAAAMSNLSGSLNSLSSTTVLDLYKPLINPNASDESLLKLSRWLTAAWGVVLIAIAILARSWGSVFTTGLTIASLAYGPMLGAFLLGVLSKRANQRGVMAGMGLSLAFMLVIYFATSIAWTWYALMGAIVCLSTGYAFSFLSIRPLRRTAAVGTLLITLFVLHGLAFTGAQTYAPYTRKLTKKEERWVQQTMAAFTLDEKIGQMMTVSTNAVFMNRESDEYKQLRRQIVENRVGGVILFRSQVWATAVLTNRLQEMAKVPLLVSSDLEMGPGMRLDDTTWWAPNMAVAATGDVKYARLQGTYTAREARAAGINWLYAPVVDVNNNPDNPVINTRSYGEDPQKVAVFATAFIEGAQAAGALATAKHFPGHGDTAIDSHLGLPVIDVTRDRLDRLELVPFRAAIAAGAGSIMTAHIALPQIEPEPAAPLRTPGENSGPRLTLPATLSHTILTSLLRENLAFKGLIVTDSMTMAGVAERYDGATSAVMAIKAGADMVLIPPDVEAAIRAVRQAVEHGEIAESRISASVERILRAKAALGLSEHRTIDIQEVDRVVSDPEFNAVAQDIANRSITLVRDERKAVPLAKTKLLAVAVIDEDNRNNTIQPLLAELRHSGLEVQAINIDNRSSDKDVERALARMDQSDAVVYCMLVKGALPPAGTQLAEELGRTHGTAIAISFGNPYLLTAMPGVPAYMAAYSPHPVSQRAAARALLGTIDITGTLPVSLPGLYPRGHGLTVNRR
jgi:SSS family transporter